MRKSVVITAIFLSTLFIIGGVALGAQNSSMNAAQDGIDIAAEISVEPIVISAQAGKKGFDLAADIANTFLQSSSLAGKWGIASAQVFAEPDALFRGRFAVELDLLKRLTLLSRLDVWDNLVGVNNRVEVVRQLERDYADALSAGRGAKEQVVSVGNSVQERADILQQEIDTLEENFFASVNDFRAQDADTDFQDFVAKKKQLVALRAEFGQYKALNERFNELIPLVARKADAINKNRDALIEGVQVDKDTAVRAGVVREVE